MSSFTKSLRTLCMQVPWLFMPSASFHDCDKGRGKMKRNRRIAVFANIIDVSIQKRDNSIMQWVPSAWTLQFLDFQDVSAHV
jgi:hypothetical protein